MTLPSQIFGRLAKLGPAHTRAVSVERDLVTKVADGTELLADRWYPTSPGADSLPTVLLRSPYGRRQLGMIGRLFAERGYQVVIQSCRGTFASGGEWIPLRNEQLDGHATLDWVAGQPWFNGQLFTFGPSYLGLSQWSVAEEAPEFVKAMALTVTASNFKPAVFFPGGTFALETALTWLYQVSHQEEGWGQVIRSMFTLKKLMAKHQDVSPLRDTDTAMVGRHVHWYQDWLDHAEPGDDWWDGIDFSRHYDVIPPATLLGGWYDIFVVAQVADFEALKAAGRPARLTIGPWTHGSPAGTGMALRDGISWFDEQLGRGRAKRQAVQVFVMGTKEWREFPEWPPPADRQSWFLGRGGLLGTESPTDGAPSTYRYDPSNPTPSAGGLSLLGAGAGPKDQAPRESRSDVLCFTSAPATKAVTVIGPVSADLHLRSSLDYTDFFVRVCDVSPKGKSINICDGIIRLTPADMARGADGTFPLTITMSPTAHTFLRGHRIRFQVSSGAHPLYVRNTGSGEPLATASVMKTADQEVFHDAEHRSRLVLPIVN
jgi:putative CocE/NonD family hydrolase